MKLVLVGLAIFIGTLLSIPHFCLDNKGKRVKGNGQLVNKTIEVGEFSEIRLGERIEGGKRSKQVFYYTQNEKAKETATTLQITIDENLYPLLEVHVTDHCLSVQAKEKGVSLAPTQMTITGSSPELKNVSVVGCIHFVADAPLHAPSLGVSVSGVGDIKLNDLTCGELDCTVSGVGNIYLKGSAEQADISVSGVGNVHGFDCAIKQAECRVSGVGGTELNVSESLKARMSGVGKIRYKGDAKADIKASGVGSIKHVD